jgi:hypothetical protein
MWPRRLRPWLWARLRPWLRLGWLRRLLGLGRAKLGLSQLLRVVGRLPLLLIARCVPGFTQPAYFLNWIIGPVRRAPRGA